MNEPLNNRYVIEIKELVTPRQIKEQLPVNAATEATVLQTRQAIRDILYGRDQHRLLVVIGPCSIHDPEAAMTYGAALKKVGEATKDHLLIVMRTYFEKPRTTVGWKGLINDPHLDGSCDIAEGLRQARTVLLDLECSRCALRHRITRSGDAPISFRPPQLVSHRSTDHREPNPSGNGKRIIHAGGLQKRHGRQSASGPQCHGRGTPASQFRRNQSRWRHLHYQDQWEPRPARRVTRRRREDQLQPEHILQARDGLVDEDIARPIMVDCSHGNSDKDHTRQIPVAHSVVKQYCEGQQCILGLLLESNLKPGKQSWGTGKTLEYGVSITDACIGWEDTETLLYELAETLAKQSPMHVGTP